MNRLRDNSATDISDLTLEFVTAISEKLRIHYFTLTLRRTNWVNKLYTVFRK